MSSSSRATVISRWCATPSLSTTKTYCRSRISNVARCGMTKAPESLWLISSVPVSPWRRRPSGLGKSARNSMFPVSLLNSDSMVSVVAAFLSNICPFASRSWMVAPESSSFRGDSASLAPRKDLNRR